MLGSLIILWLASPFPEMVDPREGWPGCRELWERATGPQPPRLGEISCWPCHDICNSNYCFAFSYSCWLDIQQQQSLDRDYRPVIREAEAVRMFWYHMDDATHDWVYVWGRRKAAERAKALLGEEDWFFRRAPSLRYRDVTP